MSYARSPRPLYSITIRINPRPTGSSISTSFVAILNIIVEGFADALRYGRQPVRVNYTTGASHRVLPTVCSLPRLVHSLKRPAT